jgi:glycosyltransferase involved in cell wall biosynthesis
VKAIACAKQADRVIAGNDRLANWASEHCRDVVVIPSCVAPERYRVRPPGQSAETPTLAWIGSRDNESHLRLIGSALVEVHRLTGARLTLIGTTEPSLGDLESLIDRVAWSEAVQHNMLASADVGLMPLPDDPYSRGKCAYKLLQYAAAGLSFVGHPVGTSADVLKHFGMPAADSPADWVDAIVDLLASPSRLDAMGSRARDLVQRNWSYDAWLPKWEDSLGAGCAATPRPDAR